MITERLSKGCFQKYFLPVSFKLSNSSLS